MTFYVLSSRIGFGLSTLSTTSNEAATGPSNSEMDSVLDLRVEARCFPLVSDFLFQVRPELINLFRLGSQNITSVRCHGSRGNVDVLAFGYDLLVAF